MKFDCILVLANEMDKEGILNAESTERVKLACEAYFKQPSAILITCGWNYRPDSKLFIGSVLKDFAINLGVPAERILTELNSRDTVGDAFFSKLNIIKKTHWKNLLVVTSDYHVSRTAEIFKFIYGPSYNIEVIGAAGFDNTEKQATEKSSIKAFEQTFKNVKEGDDSMICERLATKHPFYNGKIFPKIMMRLS